MLFGSGKNFSLFSFGARIDTPNGCLLNPEGSRLIFFDLCKRSNKNDIKVFTHTFYTNHYGEPAGIKNSTKLNNVDAWDKWHKLQMEGWIEVSFDFG